MTRSSMKVADDVWNKWLTEKDVQAADQLVEAYLPLVSYHVQRIAVNLPKSVSKEDLMSHGMLGLYDALEKFDAKRDLKFDTYASFRIRGAIIDGLRQEDWLPRSLREKAKRIEETTERLEQEYGRYVTADEVGEELNMLSSEVTRVMSESFFSNMLSIDETTQDADREETYRSTIEDTSTLTPEDVVIKKAVYKELANVIEQLNEKEKLVVSLFYFDELTLTEIGHILGLSTSRISQIHSKALFKLSKVVKNLL